jgi:tRNA pseudouridine38-40 synthase
MRYFLKIAYKGTHYHGWQVQPNAITVQGTIEKALRKILQKPIGITGSGRTDTGVHAQQQWAHIDLDTSFCISQLQYRLNAVLPPDIVINAIYPVKENSHARFDALNRLYEYSIIPTKNPFLQETHYVLATPLAINIMNQAAALLRYQTDFSSFSKINSSLKHYRCTIIQAQWLAANDERLIFRIQANRFLRGMVRSIVGNLIQVGLGKLKIEDFKLLIERKDRNLSASFAPACGLTLTKVNYPTNIFL